MVTSSEDGTVKIWETRSGTVQRSYSHGCAVNDVVIHPNQGEIISCDRGGSVRIWDLAENNCSHQLIPEEDCPVASVTVASDGSTLCAGTNSVCCVPSYLMAILTHYRAAFTSGISFNTAKRHNSCRSPNLKLTTIISPAFSSLPTSSTSRHAPQTIQQRFGR